MACERTRGNQETRSSPGVSGVGIDIRAQRAHRGNRCLADSDDQGVIDLVVVGARVACVSAGVVSMDTMHYEGPGELDALWPSSRSES